MAAKGDQFANYAIISCTESAANTLTFKKLETGISLNEKVAWVISRIEYTLSSVLAGQFNADGDALTFGLSLSNAFSSPTISENTIIDWNQLVRQDFGAAASASLWRWPIVKDFSALPGGGVIVPPTPLYLFAQGSSLVAAASAYARIHYTLLTLAVDQYWELVEARRVLSS